MKRSLFSLVLCLTLHATNVIAGQKYAFLVGISGYDEKQLKPLPYAKTDIIEFRELLLQSGFSKDNIVMLVDDLSVLPTTATPGRYLPEHQKIREELRILLPALEPDDELVIGLAGHGIQFKRDETPYFCPLDADLSDESTLISMNWLYDQLKYDKKTREGCRARAKLLIVDACRKDPESSIRRNSGGPELASLTRPQLAEPPAGVVALFSCAEGQEALEHDRLKHGVFFYHVLEGLKGKADGDMDQNVTLDEMIAFTKARTTSYVRTELRAPQTPRQKGYFDGTWILRSLDNSVKPPSPLDGFEAIFNGRDLSGWSGDVEGYEVIDGAIQCRPGFGGLLFFDRELGDFRVVVEFKIPAGGSSGLAIRSPGNGDSSYDAMTELQILDDYDPKYQKLDPRQYHGSAYGMVASRRGHLKKAGEWNVQEVTVQGSTLQVVLNGEPILNTNLKHVSEFMTTQPHPGKDRDRGFFGITGFGDLVAFRKILLKEL